MFSRFTIKSRELEIYLSDFRRETPEDIYSADAERVVSQVQRIIMASSNNGVVEAAQLKDGFFPTNFRNKYQVFISHSHADIELVKKFANTLNAKFGVRCFVDSMVWGNMYEMLRELDEKYCKTPPHGYDYDRRNMSTAHVHAMLSIALLEMIEQCECCIFVQSENSTIPSLELKSISNDVKTFSPWIYEEINYMNMLQPHRPQRLLRFFSALNENEQRELNNYLNPVPIVHGLNLDNFKEVTRDKLSYNINSERGWLDTLYHNMGLSNYMPNNSRRFL